MGVGEVVDVATAVVHVVGPKLRLAVRRRQLDNLARIFVDRMVTLNLECDASRLLLLRRKKKFQREVRSDLRKFTSSAAFSFSGLFREDLLG